MSGKQTRISIVDFTIFMQVDGQWQRVRPGQRVTGVISDDLKSNFRLVETGPDEREVLRARLKELKEPFHHSHGVARLKELLEAAESRAAAADEEEADDGDPAGDEVDESSGDENSE